MKLIVANLKMNLLFEEINVYKETLENISFTNKIVVCAPMAFVPLFKSDKYSLGAQNCYVEDKGAYTGEVSAKQLKSLGAEYVIVGHSERRSYFKEENDFINKKCLKVLENNMLPILCVGEITEEKLAGNTYNVIQKELAECLVGINNFDNLVIAYEPIWSIGTGLIPSVDEIKDAIAYIKEYVKGNYRQEVKVLYGGSVNMNNIFEIGQIDNVDGFLIGTSSININDFVNDIEKIN